MNRPPSFHLRLYDNLADVVTTIQTLLLKTFRSILHSIDCGRHIIRTDDHLESI